LSDWTFCSQISQFGCISGWLAERFLGWRFGFFGRFDDRLAENFFCWLFLKIRLYFKAKLSMTTPFSQSFVPCEKGANVFCAPTETLVQRTNDANKVGQAFF